MFKKYEENVRSGLYKLSEKKSYLIIYYHSLPMYEDEGGSFMNL